MLIENEEIDQKLEDLQKYFYDYLFSKSVKDISLSVDMKSKHWDFIKGLERRRDDLYGRKNYKIEEIYQIIIPFAEFLKVVNKDILPNIDTLIERNTPRLSLSPQEKSVRNMLLDNYEQNIYTLGSIILELYELVVVEDLKTHKDSPPLCLTIKEIVKLEEELQFIEDYQKQKK
ncbi:MAG: hypothetical protein B6229_05125 [Spirochaetaceae bacterium 4572_7]|nr:MAG: hypothetical protein B6229_05125 [Spirochaetaceae bacterium 4572_7]